MTSMNFLFSWQQWKDRLDIGKVAELNSSDRGTSFDSQVGRLQEAFFPSDGSPCKGKQPAVDCQELYIAPGGSAECQCVPDITSLPLPAASRAGDVRLPPLDEWLECRGDWFGEEWTLLRDLIKSSDDPGLDPSVASLADSIVRRYWLLATIWAVRSAVSGYQCSIPYVHVSDEDLRDYPNFDPIFYLFARQDERWPLWESWHRFCPTGYTAALYYRARALDALGQSGEALEDLENALKMSGACQEMDLIERQSWGVSSVDIELNAMRIRGFNTDDRPIFAHSEKPEGWVQYKSFRETFPEKARLATNYVWSALRQNAIYKRFYQRRAQKCPTAVLDDKSPKFVMLAAGPAMSIFMAPQIFQIWPQAQLAIFHLGDWDLPDFERCVECQEEFRPLIAKEQHLIAESLPIRQSRFIAWDTLTPQGRKLTAMDVIATLNRVFRRSKQFQEAGILFCASYLWFSLAVRMTTEKPMMMADLNYPNGIHHPRELDVRWYSQTARELPVDRVELLRTVIVRDEILRGLLPTKGCNQVWEAEKADGEVNCYDGSWEMPHFIPFSLQASYYVRARWVGPNSTPAPEAPATIGPFLLMREGSAGKFSKTMRGQGFFAAFQAFAQLASLDVKFLINSRDRLQAKDIASYRGAISFVGMTSSKRVPHDLYTMQLPLFFPSSTLMAQALGRTGYYATYDCDEGPWRRPLARDPVPPFCSWLRTAFQLELSSFSRLPHLFYFESAADLARKLAKTSDSELVRASEAMGRFLEERMKVDLAFWKDAVHALMCAGSHSNEANEGDQVDAIEQALLETIATPAHKAMSDPTCLFGILASRGDFRMFGNVACCSVECGTCEETGCDSLPPGRDVCCPSRLQEVGRLCSDSVAPCVVLSAALTQLGADCKQHPGGCASCDQHPGSCSNYTRFFGAHIDDEGKAGLT
eukprot:TRINITY_DN1750_c0_g1_i7.p1 TRINITY_DN1750_c0_g1~~TRINITY_DN1750_c0_g1_i7.p1  ORF type:complete len:928 (+),score=132.69 TRINITY_DN1750_c0_g1_i7:62-2845(+)